MEVDVLELCDHARPLYEFIPGLVLATSHEGVEPQHLWPVREARKKTADLGGKGGRAKGAGKGRGSGKARGRRGKGRAKSGEAPPAVEAIEDGATTDAVEVHVGESGTDTRVDDAVGENQEGDAFQELRREAEHALAELGQHADGATDRDAPACTDFTEQSGRGDADVLVE